MTIYVKDNVKFSADNVRVYLNTSFRDGVDLSEHGFYFFEESPRPAPIENHTLIETIENNKQVWKQIPIPADILAQNIEARRRDAYREESDPIFFKWQRGEATQQEWLDKVAEIKARYPDPVI